MKSKFTVAVDAITHAELEELVSQSITKQGVDVIVIDTDPGPSTEAGGTWWDVGVPDISNRQSVMDAHHNHQSGRDKQDKGHKS